MHIIAYVFNLCLFFVYLTDSTCNVIRYWDYVAANNWDKSKRYNLPEKFENHLCAVDRRTGGGSCGGDSGSSLVYKSPTSRYFAIGLVSGKWRKAKCGNPNMPTLYTRVNPYAEFIKQYAPDACFRNYQD